VGRFFETQCSMLYSNHEVLQLETQTLDSIVNITSLSLYLSLSVTELLTFKHSIQAFKQIVVAV